MDSSLVIYALTRGYRHIWKFKYKNIIRRNRSIKKVFGNKVPRLILFHEGNITQLDQKVISYLSRCEIDFLDISLDFKPHQNNVWTGISDFPIKYSLMCQFQYFHVWKYLKDYRYALRIDEDCYCINLPRQIDTKILECGLITAEAHRLTNQSLPQVLKHLDAEKFYDQKFPYTNVFITEVDFWLRNDVQAFLYSLFSDRNSLDFRWGDIPIIGLACKKFGNWDAQSSINKKISYRHGSHNNVVRNGQSIELSRLKKYF